MGEQPGSRQKGDRDWRNGLRERPPLIHERCSAGGLDEPLKRGAQRFAAENERGGGHDRSELRQEGGRSEQLSEPAMPGCQFTSIEADREKQELRNEQEDEKQTAPQEQR